MSEILGIVVLFIVASYGVSLSLAASRVLQGGLNLLGALGARREKAQRRHQLITAAFCELLVAHCLEVRKKQEPCRPMYEYKLRDGVDISLLQGVEQILAGHLNTYRNFCSLRDLASEELKKYGGDLIPDEVTISSNDYQKVLSDALVYNPQQHELSCGV